MTEIRKTDTIDNVKESSVRHKKHETKIEAFSPADGRGSCSFPSGHIISSREKKFTLSPAHARFTLIELLVDSSI